MTPFKNPELHRGQLRSYSKKYYENHKKEEKLRHERYRLSHKNLHAKASRKQRKKQRAEMDKYFGNSCWNCNKKRKKIHDVIKHEINNIGHTSKDDYKKGRTLPFYYNQNKERFILLCHRCHNAFHALMNFGYFFEEILEIFRWSGVRIGY